MHSFLPAFVLAFVPAVQLSPAAFSAKVERLMAASGAPGAALEVVREGEVIFRQAWGLADVEHGTPYTPELAFEIGSVSKQFTAACLLRLAEAGKLTLADPLGKHLADLPEAWRAIRIEDVLHHLSG
ncbi:MAG: serine hydrolase domain-containing protein, partial [Planctomycetota bacterium]